MEIFKIVNQRPMNLEQVIQYAASEDRVIPHKNNGYMLIGGIADNAADAFMRNQIIKELWHKTGGRQYIHFVVSPSKADIRTMSKFSQRIIKEFENFGTFYCVHQNTKHIHAHYILNSVGYNGNKFSQSKSEMLLLKHKVSEVWNEINTSEDREVEISWNKYFDVTDENIYQSNTGGYVDTSYIPNIADNYIPQIYREINGIYYPVLPYCENGKMPMIMPLDKSTDVAPMILLVDDDSNLTPAI